MAGNKFAEYIVRNNPEGASKLLVQQYGMPRTRSMQQLVQQLKYIIRTYQKQALEDIALIHPDRELIEMQNSVTEVEEVVSEPSSNCSGDTDCSACKEAESQSNSCGGCSPAHMMATGGCGCGGSSNASGTIASNCGCGAKSGIVGMTYSANGESTETTETTTPTEGNLGKAITYLSVGVVAAIVAGIIFKTR